MPEMRQFHAYDCALGGGVTMRMVLAVLLAAGGLVVAAPAAAEPETCTPVCDRIPDSAWIASWAIPAELALRLAAATRLSVTATAPRFGSRSCAPARRSPRTRAPTWWPEKAAVANPEGQWQAAGPGAALARGDLAGQAPAAPGTSSAPPSPRCAACQRTNPSGLAVADPRWNRIGWPPWSGGR